MEPAFFIDVDKHARHVVGAYDFTPISTHYAHRFERFVYTDETSIADLKPIWLEVLEAAGKVGVASGWLLFQPDEHQIGLVTVIAQVPADDHARRDERAHQVVRRRRTRSSKLRLRARRAAR